MKNRPNTGHKDKFGEDTLSSFKDKSIVLITRAGHWFHGILRKYDRHGLLITAVTRLEPVYTEEGEPVRDDELKFTIREVLPFNIPLKNSDTLVVRKMFVAWSDVQKVLRAKPLSEVEKEKAEEAQ